MKNIVLFFKLPFPLKILFLEAVLLLAYFRFLILHKQFGDISDKLGRHKEETDFTNDAEKRNKILNIKYVIACASKHTPWQSKCLVQAFTAKTMLKKRNIRSTVYLGVAKDKNGEMIAHAWTRCGEIYVTGGNGHNHFTVTGFFS
jgi:hypothetical protein